MKIKGHLRNTKLIGKKKKKTKIKTEMSQLKTLESILVKVSCSFQEPWNVIVRFEQEH